MTRLDHKTPDGKLLVVSMTDRRTLFLCTTFRYGAGNPATQHEGAMRRVRVEVPGAGRP